MVKNNDDFRMMLSLLEWELKREIKRLEQRLKVRGSDLVWKTKKKTYLEILEKVRNTTKGAG